jgi:hypothetical protein
MREPCFFPLNASRARRLTSFGFATCSVTIFISSVGEVVGFLLIPCVPMVALARLIVIAQDAHFIDNKGQPIFESRCEVRFIASACSSSLAMTEFYPSFGRI